MAVSVPLPGEIHPYYRHHAEQLLRAMWNRQVVVIPESRPTRAITRSRVTSIVEPEFNYLNRHTLIKRRFVGAAPWTYWPFCYVWEGFVDELGRAVCEEAEQRPYNEAECFVRGWRLSPPPLLPTYEEFCDRRRWRWWRR